VAGALCARLVRNSCVDAAASILLGPFHGRGVFLAGRRRRVRSAVVSSILLGRTVEGRGRPPVERPVPPTMAEVSTVIAGTLDPEELYRILPEQVMAKLV